MSSTLSQQYDNRAAAYGRDYRACDYRFKWSFIQRQQVILKWIPNLRGWRILDVGCGPGIFSAPLADKNFLTGLDLSYGMLLLAKETLRPVRGMAEHLPFRKESFDLILAVEMLQHVEFLEIFLKELCRVAKPEARLILSTLNQDSILHRVLLRRGVPKHAHTFHSLEKIHRILMGEGWEAVETRFIGFPFPISWKVNSGSPRFSPLAASWAACFEKRKQT